MTEFSYDVKTHHTVLSIQYHQYRTSKVFLLWKLSTGQSCYYNLNSLYREILILQNFHPSKKPSIYKTGAMEVDLQAKIQSDCNIHHFKLHNHKTVAFQVLYSSKLWFDRGASPCDKTALLTNFKGNPFWKFIYKRYVFHLCIFELQLWKIVTFIKYHSSKWKLLP